MHLGETENGRFDDVSVYMRNLRRLEVGTLVLTNQRLILLIPNSYQAWVCKATIFPRIETMKYEGSDEKLCLRIKHGAEYFSIQGEARKMGLIRQCLNTVPTRSQMKRRPTIPIMAPPPKVPEKVPQAATHRVGGGFGAIEEIVGEQIERNERQIKGIKSLNALKEDVEILRQLADVLAGLNQKAETTNMIQEISLALGIQSPVEANGSSSGTLAIAKEFDSFMTELFKKRREIQVVTVPEAYCFYVRARKSDMISPGDLEKALKCIGDGSMYNINIEKMGSMSIIMPKGKTFLNGAMREFRKLDRKSYLTVFSFAAKIGLPASIAKEFLKRAVDEGHLTVDETMSETRYYRNRWHKYHRISLHKTYV